MVSVTFGTMTFGAEGKEQARVSSLSDCQAILDVVKAHGHHELDTARMYTGGTSEQYLHQLDVEKQGFKVATKNFPSSRMPNGPWHKAYDHTTAGIEESITDSLQALGTDKVDLYYLHSPDRKVDFGETVAALKQQYEKGRFDRWGLSNYTAAEVEQVLACCEKHGFVKPAVYQGIYNAICRTAEPELIPTLRKHGIAFYIFNPLGGGFFSGNVKKDADVEAGSRFDPKKMTGQMYRARYFKDAFFDAVELVRQACDASHVTMPAAALRWLQHHSQLSEQYGDSIIIGASSLKHIEQNLVDLEGPPLPQSVVEALDKAWEHVRDSGAAPPYHH